MLSTAERSPEFLPTAELALWKTVLRVALLDLTRGTEYQRRSAMAWLEADGDGIGSAHFVCEIAGIDRGRLLSKARQSFLLRKKLLARATPRKKHTRKKFADSPANWQKKYSWCRRDLIPLAIGFWLGQRSVRARGFDAPQAKLLEHAGA